MVDALTDSATLSTTGEAYLARLSEIADNASRRLFAVIDGSRFDDVTGLLRSADVSHRPLYRYAGGDFDVVRGGPWFVDPYQSSTPEAFLDMSSELGKGDANLSDEALQLRSAELSARMVASLYAGDATGGGMLPGSGTSNSPVVNSRLRGLLSITGSKPAIVFWVGDETLTAETLFRHLRGLNRIAIPRNSTSDIFDGERVELVAAGGEDALSEPLAEGAPATEMVVFRHADPNVLMQVLPALDESQALRLFGPAEQIFFAPDPLWGGGVKRGRRPGLGVFAGRGMLQLSPEMIAMIENFRMQASRLKVVAYLHDVHPATEAVSERSMMERVLAYEIAGARLGLASERAHMKWAYLMSITDGECDTLETEKFFAETTKHPDDAIDDLLIAFDTAAGDDWQHFWGQAG